VALTAYNDEKLSCINAGMSRFLTKPASSADIREVLQDL
jgi:CheY-like chemotaxis protein